MNTPQSDAAAHHAANAAAVAIPVGSVIFRLPEIVTLVVGVLGIIWYAILIAEKMTKWWQQLKQIRQSAHRVAVKDLKEHHDDYKPPAPH